MEIHKRTTKLRDLKYSSYSIIMSDLAKKHKKATASTAAKTTGRRGTKKAPSRFVDTEAAESKKKRTEAKEKRKTGKAKTKKDKGEPTSQEIDPAIADASSKVNSKIRIERAVGVFMQEYSYDHPRPTNIERAKARGNFPVIYDHLQIQKPFTEDELKKIRDDSRVPENIFQMLQEYNSILLSLPKKFVEHRSNILAQIDRVPMLADRPVFLEYLIRRDQPIFDEELRDLRIDYSMPEAFLQQIRDYNEMLETFPHPTREVQLIEFTGKTPTYSRDELADLDDIRRKIEEEGLELAAEPEDKESEAQDSPSSVRQYVANYRGAIRQILQERKKIAASEKGEDVNPEPVSEREISDYILRRNDLPYWAFLVEYARNETTLSRQETMRLFSKFPEISIQFVTLFTRISANERVQFVRNALSYYSEVYKDYSIGTSSKFEGDIKTVLTLLITFVNKLPKIQETVTSDERFDIKIATSSGSKLFDTVMTLSPVSLLIYRPIIFTRIQSGRMGKDIEQVLERYTPYLTSGSKLVVDHRGSELKVMDEATGTLTNESFVVSYSSKDEILGDAISKFISRNIKLILSRSDLPSDSPLTKDQVKQAKSRNDPSSLLTEVVREMLSQHFHAIVVDTTELRDLITDTVTSIIEENYRREQEDISAIGVDVPDNMVDELERGLDEARQQDRGEISIEELRTEAAKLGITLKQGVVMSKEEAKKIMRSQVESGTMTEEQYNDAKKKIGRIIGAYNDLSKMTQKTLDPELATIRRLLNKRHQDIVDQMILDRQRALGFRDLSDRDVQSIGREAWSIAVGEEYSLPSGKRKITSDELESLTSRSIKGVGVLARQRKEKQIRAILETMPSALKTSLDRLMTSLKANIDASIVNKRDELRNYYKFVTEVIVANWNLKTGTGIAPRLLQEIELSYTEVLPLPFMKKIFELLRQKGVTGTTLLSYVKTYATGTTKILKNPLQNQGARRRLRHEKIYHEESVSGTVTQVRRTIPEFVTPYLKKCIATHVLKPWLDIPSIQDWTFAIALVSGKPRDQMDDRERSYFNVPRDRQIAVRVDSGTGKKLLYFYKPTTNYFVGHCQSYHKETNPIKCDEAGLTKTLKDPSGKIGFYEMMFKGNLRGKIMEDGTLLVDYNGDTDSIKFLSMDPSAYKKECAWYARNALSAEEKIAEYEGRLMTGSIEASVRKTCVDIIGKIMIGLRLSEGITTEQGDTARALEAAIWNYLTEKGDGAPPLVYMYLKEVFTFVLFIDKADVLGKNAKFFSSLVAQSSKAYYPYLIRQYPTYMSRLPEIFFSSAEAELKDLAKNYIERRVEWLIDTTVLSMLAIDTEDRQSVSALFKARAESINAAFPSKMGGFLLKNVCKNADDYKGMQDSWLTYYVKGDDVYCVSKLELSQMAMTGNYYLKGVEFSKEFVEGFKSFSEYAANEIQKRNKYLDSIVKGLVMDPKNLDLLNSLASHYSIFGEINESQLIEYNILERLVGTSNLEGDMNRVDQLMRGLIGKPVSASKRLSLSEKYGSSIDYVVIAENILERINDIVASYISSQVLESARKFISDNNDILYRAINEAKSSSEVAGPFPGRDLLLGSAADIVVRHVNDTSSYSVSESDRNTIIKFIDEMVYTPESERLAIQRECGVCQAKVSQLEYSTIVQREDASMKFVHFCSSKCFSKYKIDEPTKEKMEMGKLRASVNKLTENYLTYAEMLYWAKFPSRFRVPMEVEERDEMISRLAKIRGVEEENISEALDNLPANEHSLGIVTVDRQGRNISQTELWERIKTSPRFVPAVNEMLKDDKMASLLYLARKFQVSGVYSTDLDEAIPYYSANPQLLRNMWKELRGKRDFEDLLFSTVTTFDPKKSQDIPPDQLLDYVLSGSSASAPSINLDITVWTTIKEQIDKNLKNIAAKFKRNEKGEYPTLMEVLSSPERFKVLRRDLFIDISKKHPQLFDPKNNKLYVSLKKSLERWYTVHSNSFTAKKPLIDLSDSHIYVDASGETHSVMPFEQMVRELGKLCGSSKRKQSGQKLTLQTLSRWTMDTMKEYEAKNYRMIQFNTGFYVMLVKHYGCEKLAEMERQYSDFSFNMEKVNNAIDDSLATLAEQQQHKELPEVVKPSISYGKLSKTEFVKRRRAKLEKMMSERMSHETAEDDIETLLDRLSSTSGAPSTYTVSASATPQIKSKATILEEIKKMRASSRTEKGKKQLKLLYSVASSMGPFSQSAAEFVDEIEDRMEDEVTRDEAREALQGAYEAEEFAEDEQDPNEYEDDDRRESDDYGDENYGEEYND